MKILRSIIKLINFTSRQDDHIEKNSSPIFIIIDDLLCAGRALIIENMVIYEIK